MMPTPVSTRIDSHIAVITISNPPVNGLNHAVRLGLYEAFAGVRSRDDVAGVVLVGDGPCFSAGGDLNELGTPLASAEPGLSKHVHGAIENCGKTVVAAIHGYALGGGLETAMACHYRVATARARLALPEARIGVIPLSGTQRLPRLIGIEAAIDMILNAREILAEDAPKPLIDTVAAPDDLLAVAADWAKAPPTALARNMPLPDDAPQKLANARAALAAGVYPPFAKHLLAAMECGVNASFDDAVKGARTIYDAVVGSHEARAAREAFFAGRRAPILRT